MGDTANTNSKLLIYIFKYEGCFQRGGTKNQIHISVIKNHEMLNCWKFDLFCSHIGWIRIGHLVSNKLKIFVKDKNVRVN